MIPKIIHYCWVGPRPKNKNILDSIKSFSIHNPDFVIKEWNESNFAINENPFTKRMYAEKKYAFVADYIRLHALIEEGGIYLDADMLLVQSLTPLLNHSCLLGEESPGTISAGMIGSIPHHSFIKACKKFYDTELSEIITIPRILTEVFDNYPNKQDLTVLPPKAFYPFTAKTIKQYHGQHLGSDVYGVHLWDYSWGHPLNKAFKKIGIYYFGKKVVELLGIKKILKRLLKFI